MLRTVFSFGATSQNTTAVPARDSGSGLADEGSPYLCGRGEAHA